VEHNHIPAYKYEHGKGWVEAVESEVNQDMSGLTLITFNTWFGEYCFMQRTAALLECLRQTEAHVVALQEVTTPLLDYIKRMDWIQENCFLSDCHGPTYERYGTMLISRLPFKKLTIHRLPSQMGRGLLVGEFVVGDESLLVATVHLESMKPMAEQRIEQLGLIFPLLEHGDNTFLMGDFNFHTDQEEQNAINPQYLDQWPLCHPQDPGYTYDTERNNMLQRMRGQTKTTRYDRILFRSKRGTWQPQEMQILGTRPINDEAEQVYISDHFGLRLDMVPR